MIKSLLHSDVDVDDDNDNDEDRKNIALSVQNSKSHQIIVIISS